MVAGGAGGVWRGLSLRLGLSRAVCGADLEGIFPRPGVPGVDVVPPGIHLVELGGESRFVPGLAAVGGDLDALDAALWRPGDAADGDPTRGEALAALHGIDAGLGLHG